MSGIATVAVCDTNPVDPVMFTDAIGAGLAEPNTVVSTRMMRPVTAGVVSKISATIASDLRIEPLESCRGAVKVPAPLSEPMPLLAKSVPVVCGANDTPETLSVTGTLKLTLISIGERFCVYHQPVTT